MNKASDMNHVRSANDLRQQISTGERVTGMFGDTIGGKSFTDDEARMLEALSAERRGPVGSGWQTIWAGPGMTAWTVINCRQVMQWERTEYARLLNETE